MANSSHFGSLAELQGPGGRGRFEAALREPLADGCAVDVVYTTLVETRLNVNDWVQEHTRNHRGSKLDTVLLQNARREGLHHTKSRFRSFAEGIAASYNGNLKSVLAFDSGTFAEDECKHLFGRLTDAKVAGLPIPNPKKAFMGRSIYAHREGPAGVRLCFVGAHFPIAKVAAALEDTHDPLNGAKIALARTLRRVLRKASNRGIVDERTVLFVQGDLNSRTFLHEDESGNPTDVLMDVLADDAMQSAIHHEIVCPSGRWRELVDHESVEDLPVTYKFHECTSSDASAEALTIGAIMDASRSGLLDRTSSFPNFDVGDSSFSTGSRCSGEPSEGAMSIYKRILLQLGHANLEKYGLQFKKSDFRPFRFPACADRVLYWIPDNLGNRIQFDLPQNGYEVNYAQGGSDHRPVCLEVKVTVQPESNSRSPRRISVISMNETLGRSPWLVPTLAQIHQHEDSDGDSDGLELGEHAEEEEEAEEDRSKFDRHTVVFESVQRREPEPRRRTSPA